MKKVLIITNILTLLGLVYCYYSKNNDQTQTTSSPCSNPCYGSDSDTLQGLIDYELAKKMSADYGADYGKKFVYHNGKPTSTEDARNIWFDLNKLKKFISFIERNACKNGCKKDTRFGIRIYYAKYPSEGIMSANASLAGVPIEYANHHTLFLVPTYYDATSKSNINFDPSAIKENCFFQPIDPTKAKVWFALPSSEDGSPENHGQLMPPPGGTGSF